MPCNTIQQNRRVPVVQPLRDDPTGVIVDNAQQRGSFLVPDKGSPQLRVEPMQILEQDLDEFAPLTPFALAAHRVEPRLYKRCGQLDNLLLREKAVLVQFVMVLVIHLARRERERRVADALVVV